MNLFEFLTENDDAEPEPQYDFKQPEDVLIEVRFEENRLKIDSVLVLGAPEDPSGYASYQYGEVGCLLDELEQCFGIPDFPDGPGWYVVQQVTGEYYPGDGWSYDDDSQIEYGDVRRATLEEISLQVCEPEPNP